MDSIRSSTSAGSGHPTSSMSAADLMAVLVGRHLRYDWDDPGNAANDHLIFSKGHASPLLYSIYKAVGVVSDEELMTEYRRFGSRLEGHPTPVLPWVDVATGSLGQGLPDAVGVALAGKYLDELPYRVWVLCGDSEMAEGSIWEALDKASYYKLANLIAIIDINRLGQRGPTELSWDLDSYAARAAAFGARVFVIDGHDLAAIDQALAEAGDLSGHQPSVIVARTRKGRGFSEVEDREGWHGKPLPEHMAERAVVELGGERNLLVRGPRPAEAAKARPAADAAEVKLPGYERGQKVATRKAYGDALAALGVRPNVVAMDGEVSNSTFADEFAKAMVVTVPSLCRAGHLLGHGEERLALFHDVGGECAGAGAGAGVAYRVGYPGRDGQGLAGVVHLGGLAVDLVLQRAFQDVDDLLTRMGVPDRGRVRLDVDARLDHLASGDGKVVALQAGAPQSRRELDRRAWDGAVLLGGAHLGLPAGGVRNDATIPAAAFRQGHPWRLTLACAVPGRYSPKLPRATQGLVWSMARMVCQVARSRKSRIMPLRILPNRSRQCCQSSCAVARSRQLALKGACPPGRGIVRGQLRGRPARARASPRARGGAAVICALSQTRVIQGAGQGLRPGI